jgi:hypothetical protein
MADISNTDDVIDSRDVIARFEELTESRKPFYAGWNMPGYMPDSESARFASFEEAAAYLAEEMARECEDSAQDLIDDNTAAEKIADLESAQARLAEAKGPAYGETIGAYHYFIDEDNGVGSFDSESDSHEWCALRDLIAEASKYAADWEYGETLIRDSYFREYAQELAEDCSPFPSNSPEGKALAMWPYRCIDWDQAARELQMDYTSVDFDGITYWIR